MSTLVKTVAPGDMPCLSPLPGTILNELCTKYPRHYNLRGTLTSAMPVSDADGNDYLVYLIRQDTEDGHPRFHYLLYNPKNQTIHEFACTRKKAKLITSQGLFFISHPNENWDDNSVYWLNTFFEGTTDEQEMVRLHKKDIFQTITSIQNTKHGLFIEGITEENKTGIYYKALRSFGKESNDKHENQIYLLPEDTNSKAWWPDNDARCCYAIGGRVIHVFNFGTGIHNDSWGIIPLVQIGITHTVVPTNLLFDSPVTSHAVLQGLTGETPSYAITDNGQSHVQLEAKGFPTSTAMELGIGREWVPVGHGLVTLFMNNNKTVVTYHDLLDIEHTGQGTVIFEEPTDKTSVILPKDKSSFYLRINGQWHTISHEQISALKK